MTPYGASVSRSAMTFGSLLTLAVSRASLRESWASRRANHPGAEPLRSWRLNAGLTVDELANLAGIAPNTVRRLEAGYRSATLGHAAEREVAQALGVTVGEITFGAVEDGEPTIDLAAEREARKLVEGEVAKQANVPLRTVRRAEAGVAIAPRYALRLAAFYGCRVTRFLPARAQGGCGMTALVVVLGAVAYAALVRVVLRRLAASRRELEVLSDREAAERLRPYGSGSKASTIDAPAPFEANGWRG